VFVALDPEFAVGRTKPGGAIGSIDASDINAVQWYLDALAQQHLPKKMLIVHRSRPNDHGRRGHRAPRRRRPGHRHGRLRPGRHQAGEVPPLRRRAVCTIRRHQDLWHGPTPDREAAAGLTPRPSSSSTSSVCHRLYAIRRPGLR
jgi:hypothetical protein